MQHKLNQKEKEAVIAASLILKDHAALTHRLKGFVKAHANQETIDLQEDLFRGESKIPDHQDFR